MTMCVKAYPLMFSETSQKLINENLCFKNTGGVSAGNRAQHFIPAFLDFETGAVYISSYRNGHPAPIHLYDGLPQHLIMGFNSVNKPNKVKPSVVSGFVHEQRFYTREQAKNRVQDLDMGK